MNMKIYIGIWFMLLTLLAGCEDDFCGKPDAESGVEAGTIVFRVSSDLPAQIQTRVGEGKQSESLENVLVMVFDKAGQLVNKVYQQLTVDNHSVSLYLTAADGQVAYALCNLPEGDEKVAELIKPMDASVPFTLDQLKAQYTEVRLPDGVYAGKHVMSGSEPLELTALGMLKPEYAITVKRLTAQFNFTILFQPDRPADRFAVGEVMIHNVPKGSMLLDGGGVGEENSWGYHHAENPLLDSLDICQADYSYRISVSQADRSKQFFQKQRLDFERIQGPLGENNSYTSSFKMFENRQGRVYDDVANWKNLSGLIGQGQDDVGSLGYEDLYRYYQQINKRGLAGTTRSELDKSKIFKRNEGINRGKYTVNETEQGFKYATYLTVRGVYTKKNVVGQDEPIDVIYYVYLGHDNYKDFNVCRNHTYNYTLRIFDVEKTDTRVDAKPIGGLSIWGNFDEVLDAHPNVTQTLIYAPDTWTVRVKDPDQTPWLEVSTSAQYKPRKVGSIPSSDQASFVLKGESGLHYLYIHTDEYIPPLNNPHDNDRIQPREGVLQFISSNGEVLERTIKQYPAQMVIRKWFATDKARTVQDTFYVERILEKKNMQWGFHHYWCFKLDEVMTFDLNSNWNGLRFTRTLYDVGMNGDKWGIDPAWPDGKIPTDIAVGYALAKNRDRNGNGKIDYNEIVWYLPCYGELQAIAGHINEGSKHYPVEFTKTVDVDWKMDSYNFVSSTPSSSDKAGITTGFTWAVLYSPNLKKNGKTKVEMRSRFFNVICARQYNGWQGPDTGTTGGTVKPDENWNEDEEEIMGKK